MEPMEDIPSYITWVSPNLDQAKIYYKDNFLCSGTILTTYLILTAAHCFKQGNKTRMDRYNIRIEGRDPRTRVRLRQPPILHEAWEAEGFDDKSNDIALLELDDDLRDVQPTILSLTRVYNQYGQINAFGGMNRKLSTTNFGEFFPETFFMTANVTLLDRWNCQAYWDDIMPDKTFCAQGNGVDACAGDTAKPVSCWVNYTNFNQDPKTVKKVFCGFPTFGVKNVKCGDTNAPTYKPTVYTDVTKYTKWILQQSCLIRERHLKKCNPYSEFQCCNKFCIPRSSQCDGFPDCLDGSDEENCGVLRKARNHCPSNDLCLQEKVAFTAIFPVFIYLNTAYPVHIFSQPNSNYTGYNFSAWIKDSQSGINEFQSQGEILRPAYILIEGFPKTEYDLVLMASDSEENEFYWRDRIIRGDDHRNFVYTDKNVYSGGETIHFGAIFLDSPYGLDLSINIAILDSSNNTIWKASVNDTSEIEQAFLSHHLRLDGVQNGTWKIVLHRKDSLFTNETFDSKFEKTFEVQILAPPRFSVNVKVPGHLATEIAGTLLDVYVRAENDFGENIDGRCIVEVEVVCECGSYLSESLRLDYKLDESRTQRIDVADITRDFLNGGTLQVKATVTEGNTGQALTQFASTRFSSRSVIIQELSSHRVRRPGLPYYAEFRIIDQNQKKILAAREIKVTTNAQLTVLQNGDFEIKIPPPHSNTSEYFQITYTTTSFAQTISMIESNATQHLQIRLLGNSTKEILQNAPFKIHVMTTDEVDVLHMIIHSAGEIIFSHSYQPAYAKEYVIDTNCPEEIGLEATIVVFTYINSEFVSDALHLNIRNWRQKTNPVFDLSVSTDVVEPGQNISISIQALPNSFVYLHAEDSAYEDPDEFASKKWLIEQLLQSSRTNDLETDSTFADLRQLDLAVLSNVATEQSYSHTPNNRLQKCSKY